MRISPKAPRDFVWQIVLVDRELLARAVTATRAAGASEAIDQALTLAARRTERGRRRARTERRLGEDGASYPVH